MPREITFSPLSDDYDNDIVTATTRLVKDVPFRFPELLGPILWVCLLFIIGLIVYKILNLKDPSVKEDTDVNANVNGSNKGNFVNNNSNNGTRINNLRKRE
jgi:hypothetical protein